MTPDGERPRGALEIKDALAIPLDELWLTAVRSGGPGGQNVNKVSTRVILRFDVVRSPSLAPAQKSRILEKLRTRINREGVLRVVAQTTRSQAANRAAALDRFARLLREALEPETPRVATRVPDASKRRRLDDKRRRSTLKRARSRDGSES